MVRGILAALFIGANTVLACIPLFTMALIRLPLTGDWRGAMDRRMDWIIDYWVGSNRHLFRVLRLCQVDFQCPELETLSRDHWYIVVCNHQSWTDIVLLQTTLLPHLPPIKFFTKSQLKWIPFLGVAMMVLGFPYVRRVTPAQIEKRPELKGLDRRSTLAACELLKAHPTSVLNFLEGTRFTPVKHAAQANPRYQHLLNPKIGGLQYVLEGMGEHIHGLLDVTIVYPTSEPPSFWDFLCGRAPTVVMRAQLRQVPDLLHEVDTPEAMRPLVADWANELWQTKDLELTQHHTGAPMPR